MPLLGNLTIKNRNWNSLTSNKALPYSPALNYIQWSLEGTSLGLTVLFFFFDNIRLQISPPPPTHTPLILFHLVKDCCLRYPESTTTESQVPPVFKGSLTVLQTCLP